MKYLFAFLSILVLILGSGCSEQPSAPETSTQPEVSDYTHVDIPYMEGIIRDLITTPEPEEAVTEDPNSPQLSLSDTYFNIHRVKIMWGHMFNPLPDSNYLDMSGRLMITPPGVVAVRRTVAFENDDYIVRVNDAEINRFLQSVQWVAHISDLDSDGLVVEIFSARFYLATVIPQMIIDIYGQTFVFDFKMLDEMDTVIALDSHNDLWIKSKKVTPPDCLKGYLGGAWIHKSYCEGFFYGKWYAVDNTLMGYLAGEFTTGDDGVRTFRGGWCDCLGIFQGYLKGTWAYNNVTSSVWECPRGTFRGIFTDTFNIVRGHLFGEFGPFVDDVANTHSCSQFKGQWSTCNATDQIVD